MQYDETRNLTTDTYSGAAVMRAYDAENRMTSETQANSYDAGSYTYDGNGRRVKRIADGTETWQVYGLGGELLAESSQDGAALTPQKEYGYGNGQLLIIATAPSGLAANKPPTAGPGAGTIASSTSGTEPRLTTDKRSLDLLASKAALISCDFRRIATAAWRASMTVGRVFTYRCLFLSVSIRIVKLDHF